MNNLENLRRYLEDEENYEIDGIDYEHGCIQTIDRNQAIDGEGHAVYDEYVFYKIGEYYPAKCGSFTAEQFEQFAQSW